MYLKNKNQHKTILNRLRTKSCVSYCSFLVLDPPQTMGTFLDILIARRTCMCVSGKVVLWLKMLTLPFGPNVLTETL